jgi:hypothetical protein
MKACAFPVDAYAANILIGSEIFGVALPTIRGGDCVLLRKIMVLGWWTGEASWSWIDDV